MVAQAVKALMAKATDTQTMNNHAPRRGHTFGKTAQDAVALRASLRSTPSRARSARRRPMRIQLMSIPLIRTTTVSSANELRQTRSPASRTRLRGTIGKGTSDVDRQKIVFFVKTAR